MDIIQVITDELKVEKWQVEAAVKLIDEGCTIPFISRYRKEATGSLNDEQLRSLHERLLYLRNLEDKKKQVLTSIEEQGKLTPELKKQILDAKTLVVVEDLYRPYRPKRRTRAIIAKEKGLEPLANIIMLQMTKKPLEEEAQAFVSAEKGVETVEDALNGAKDILAETISDEADYRIYIRDLTMKKGSVASAAKKPEESSVYEMYYEFELGNLQKLTTTLKSAVLLTIRNDILCNRLADTGNILKQIRNYKKLAEELGVGEPTLYLSPLRPYSHNLQRLHSVLHQAFSGSYRAGTDQHR